MDFNLCFTLYFINHAPFLRLFYPFGRAVKSLSFRSQINFLPPQYHISNILQTLAPFRATATGEEILEKMVDLINTKNRDSIRDLDLILWTLSNFCSDHQRLFRLGQKTMAALIELMSNTNEQVSKHALRCVASLTVARTFPKLSNRPPSLATQDFFFPRFRCESKGC
jgi:hypothetical protein